MRPKHVLWIAVALLWSTWYLVDPEAHGPSNQVQTGATAPVRPMVAATPSGTPNHRVALRHGP